MCATTPAVSHVCCHTCSLTCVPPPAGGCGVLDGRGGRERGRPPPAGLWWPRQPGVRDRPAHGRQGHVLLPVAGAHRLGHQCGLVGGWLSPGEWVTGRHVPSVEHGGGQGAGAAGGAGDAAAAAAYDAVSHAAAVYDAVSHAAAAYGAVSHAAAAYDAVLLPLVMRLQHILAAAAHGGMSHVACILQAPRTWHR